MLLCVNRILLFFPWLKQSEIHEIFQPKPSNQAYSLVQKFLKIRQAPFLKKRSSSRQAPTLSIGHYRDSAQQRDHTPRAIHLPGSVTAPSALLRGITQDSEKRPSPCEALENPQDRPDQPNPLSPQASAK